MFIGGGYVNTYCMKRGYSVSFLYDRQGQRKYLTAGERRAFLETAWTLPNAADRLFCVTLALSGARLSEILDLTPARLDPEAGVLVVRSLKKRRSDVFRAIPTPKPVLAEVSQLGRQTARGDDTPIWDWGRTTGWKKVKQVMETAGIHGPQASPKGLRHGFAISALEAGVPLTLISRWLGHSQIATTAIYVDAVGAEERSFARRMWQTLPETAEPG